MKLVFEKMIVSHNGNWDSEEGNSLLFRSSDRNYK